MKAFEKALKRLNDEHDKRVAKLMEARGRIEEAQSLCDALNDQLPSDMRNLATCVTVHEYAPTSVRILAWSWWHSLEAIRNAIKSADLVIERELEAIDLHNKPETIIWIKGIDCRLVWTLEHEQTLEAA